MAGLNSGNIRNFDCVALVSKIDRFMVEIKDSVSATANNYREADKIRLQSYINAVTAWLDYSSRQPQIDKPHSHPLLHEIGEPPVAVGGSGVDIDNEAARALLHELGTMRINIISSQSADAPGNYVPQDLERFRSYVGVLQSLLTDFIERVLPLDLPETSVHGK